MPWASKEQHKVRPWGQRCLRMDWHWTVVACSPWCSLTMCPGRHGQAYDHGAGRCPCLPDPGRVQKHGLTLEHVSSITEQQIAGWTQASAHGTGALFPPVDEMITSMSVVTPAQGALKSALDGPDPDLFRWIRVGLGTLGVVSKVTLKCIPKYTLHERTYCTTVDELRRGALRLSASCPAS